MSWLRILAIGFLAFVSGVFLIGTALESRPYYGSWKELFKEWFGVILGVLAIASFIAVVALAIIIALVGHL